MSASILIDAGLRARLRGLRLDTRLGTAAQGIGQHASRSRGVGLEFAQYRAYEPGDELRRIDWKLYGRSDRYFVREAERDSPLDVLLLLDATASMRQADRAQPQWRKFDAARQTALCLAEMAVAQGDRVGCVSVSGKGLGVVPMSSGLRHRDRLTLELQGLDCAGEWPDEAVTRRIWEQAPAQCLVIGLSDAYDEAYVAMLEGLARARREVVSLQWIAADEREFPFEGGHRFVDPETGASQGLDATAARPAFLEAYGAARAALSRRCASAGIRHLEAMLDAPVHVPLQRLFGPRSGAAA